MDTVIGNFNLTDKQFRQTKSLKSSLFKGFSYFKDDGRFVVVSDRDLTAQEIADLSSAISALPDTEPQDEVNEKQAKKSRKRQLLDALATLTGLTRNQVLRCFNEIVQDQNDD